MATAKNTLKVRFSDFLLWTFSCHSRKGENIKNGGINMFKKIILYFHRNLVRLYRYVRATLDNNCAEGQIPDNILAELARCFARDIPAFFADPANQEAYIKWLEGRQQLAQEQSDKTDPVAY